MEYLGYINDRRTYKCGSNLITVYCKWASDTQRYRQLWVDINGKRRATFETLSSPKDTDRHAAAIIGKMLCLKEVDDIGFFTWKESERIFDIVNHHLVYKKRLTLDLPTAEIKTSDKSEEKAFYAVYTLLTMGRPQSSPISLISSNRDPLGMMMGCSIGIILICFVCVIIAHMLGALVKTAIIPLTLLGCFVTAFYFLIKRVK